jgi:hypothetical protein
MGKKQQEKAVDRDSMDGVYEGCFLLRNGAFHPKWGKYDAFTAIAVFLCQKMSRSHDGTLAMFVTRAVLPFSWSFVR